MTLIERLEQIAQMTQELAQMTRELHEEIDEAINHPEWVLPTDVKEINNDSKNNSTKDTSGEEGREPETPVL